MPDSESPDRIHALIALYRATQYDVTLPDGRVATLRIGESAPSALRDWIGADRVATFLTACNPRSQSLPPDHNERRLAALRVRLHALSCRFLEGVGHLPGDWQEPSLLVAGTDLAVVDTLARDFEQSAAVRVSCDCPAVLRLYRAEWRAAITAEADLEWAADTLEAR
ncbi:DUF3293 domain-containing protein [Dokdonella soli]|uniref:DUF3293 domain-containing protein n=1 Tax=Dokdonella soli TaxID=529810 RepID=A0ABP3TQ71_9GAMM